MAIEEIVHGMTTWTIDAGDEATRATLVPQLGAIGSSLKLPSPDGSRETLFQHEHFWDPASEQTRGGLPFLFPICGRLERGGEAETYLYDAHRYTMKIHGFAHRMAWRVVAADKPSELVMECYDNESTREQYPFAFSVRLTYRVEPGALVCEQHYHNRGDRPMPYYAGFHPYFLTPPPGKGKSGVHVTITPKRVLAYNERLTDIIGVKEKLPVFPVSIADPAINEQLIEWEDDGRASLRFPDGFALHLCVGSDEHSSMFPYVQLYTMDDKPFFCVEPWMGFPNALNAVAGVRWIAPGASERAWLRIASC